ncbi:hypothetical protein T492DRAFT_847326 [Pavlovales sp. CCMP2436]|nr:hypothetical protein T492DRAFT_847326 [Pavlovales sp. CCMP2436]
MPSLSLTLPPDYPALNPPLPPPTSQAIELAFKEENSAVTILTNDAKRRFSKPASMIHLSKKTRDAPPRERVLMIIFGEPSLSLEKGRERKRLLYSSTLALPNDSKTELSVDALNVGSEGQWTPGASSGASPYTSYTPSPYTSYGPTPFVDNA